MATSVSVTIGRKGGREDEPTTLSFERFPVTIGRAETNDLVLVDAMVSRRHAILEVRGGDLWWSTWGARPAPASTAATDGDKPSTRRNGLASRCAMSTWHSLTWRVEPSITVTLGAFQLTIAKTST